MPIIITKNIIEIKEGLDSYEHRMFGSLPGDTSEKEFELTEGHDVYVLVYKDKISGRGIISPRTYSKIILSAKIIGLIESEQEVIREIVRKSYLPQFDRIWGRHASKPLSERYSGVKYQLG